MLVDFWGRVDSASAISSEYRFTQEERQHLAKEEQAAYEANIPTMTKILEELRLTSPEGSFWTECFITKGGLRFRYQLQLHSRWRGKSIRLKLL